MIHRRNSFFSAPDEPKAGESTNAMDRWRWMASMIVVILVGIAILSLAQAPAVAVAMQATTPSPSPAAATVVPTAARTVTVTVGATSTATTTAALSSTLPIIPAPVAVQVDPKTTALLILDVTSTICAPRASCVATLPFDAALLKKARDAQALVAYSDTPGTSTILTEVAPQANDPKVTGRADKFYGTNLDDLLKAKGIKTVVIVGYVANGAVLYTTFGANLRAYTVVVPVDGTGAEDPFAATLTYYQLLNEPGFNNPDNKPLVEGRVTLSRSDLVTFVPGAAPPKPLAPAQSAVITQTVTAPTVAPTVASTSTTTASSAAATAQPTTATSSSAQSGKVDLNKFMPPGKGRDLLLNNCTSCHSFVCAIKGQRPVDSWQSVKIGHRDRVSSLSDDDYGALFAYLAENFNDKKPSPELPPELQDLGCSSF